MCTPLRWLYRAIDTISKRTPIVTVGSQGSPRGGAEYDFRAPVDNNNKDLLFLFLFKVTAIIFNM